MCGNSWIHQGEFMSSVWFGTSPIPTKMILLVVSRPMVKLVITVLVAEPIFGIISLEFVNGPLLGHMPNYWLSIPWNKYFMWFLPKKNNRINSEALCVQFPSFPVTTLSKRTHTYPMPMNFLFISTDLPGARGRKSRGDRFKVPSKEPPTDWQWNVAYSHVSGWVPSKRDIFQT